VRSIINSDPYDNKKRLAYNLLSIFAMIFIASSIIFTLNKNYPTEFALNNS
jgi:hypothetical protein